MRTTAIGKGYARRFGPKNGPLGSFLSCDYAKGISRVDGRIMNSVWPRPGIVPRSFHCPRWNGSPLEGKTILVHAEQGLGDTIQFVRYLAMMKSRGGQVLFECPPDLVGILAGIPEVDQIVAEGSPLPPYDLQVPLLSLPGIFQTTLDTIPAQVPYLHADPEKVSFWRKELEPLHGLKVGIVWQGNPKFSGDQLRSIPLNNFESWPQPCLASAS